MKSVLKLLTLYVLLGFSFQSFGQEKFDTYSNSYASNKYDISISLKKDKFTLWIDAMSLESVSSKGGFVIHQGSEYVDFVLRLEEAASKYKEWVEVAKSNNVTDLDKDMSMTCNVGAYFLYGRNWHFQNVVKMTFDFKIMESDGVVKYLLLARSGPLVSSSNKYIDTKGFVLVFSDSKEIEDFLSKITPEKIEAYKGAPKTEDLFTE